LPSEIAARVGSPYPNEKKQVADTKKVNTNRSIKPVYESEESGKETKHCGPQHFLLNFLNFFKEQCRIVVKIHEKL